MKLITLKIIRMPGFEESGFTLQNFSSGLNIIIGPNASGKTTTCRAIQGLLWPEKLESIPYPGLAGIWEKDQQELLIEINGRDILYQLNGQSTDPPQLPELHLSDCYIVSIDDLFEGSGATDSELASQVRREMVGGFDLGVLRQSSRFSVSPQKARNAAKDLQKARMQVAELQQAYAVLKNEEAELELLEEEFKQARQAEREQDSIKSAQEVLNIKDRIDDLNAALSEFPDQIDRLLGDELQKTAELQKALEEQEGLLKDYKTEIAQAAAVIKKSGLPNDTIGEEDFSVIESKLEKLRDSRDLISSQTIKLEELRAELANIAERFGAKFRQKNLDRIGEANLNQIENFQHRYQEVKAGLTAVNEQISLVEQHQDGSGADIDADDLAKAVNLLREWLRSPAADSVKGRNKQVELALLFSFLAAALIISLAVWQNALLFLICLLPLALIVWTLLLLKPDRSKRRSQIEETVGRIQLEMPEVWTETAIEAYLDQYEKQLGRLRQSASQQDQLRKLKAQQEKLLQSSLELEQERKAKAELLELDSDSSVLALSVMARNLIAYQERSDQIAGIEAVIERERHLQRRRLDQICSEFSKYNLNKVSDYETAQLQLTKVRKIAADAAVAIQQLKNVEKSASLAEEKITELKTKRSQLFRSLGIADNDQVKLQNMLRELPIYRKQQEELKGLERDFRKRSAELQQNDSSAELLWLSREELELKAEELVLKASTRDEIQERIGGIKTRINQARSSHQLEKALGERDAALQKLENIYQHELTARCSEFLLNEAEKQYQAESQPEVFKQASSLFKTFTRGCYELLPAADADNQLSSFRAYETARQRGLELHQLSRGTRIQLLLAARFAFAVNNDRGLKIPIILDEVLSNSDPVRFRAVAEALLTMVKQGRQVFYLSCQPSDGNAWKQLAEESALADFKILNLADKVYLEEPETALLGDPAVRSLPLEYPGDRSLDDYLNSITVPPLKPQSGASAAHLAYLIEDTHCLYNLLQGGVFNFGQLKTLVSQGSFDAYLSRAAYEKIAARAAVVDSFKEAWQIGRGKPLTPEAIIDLCPSKRFQPELIEKAKEIGWQAGKLLEAIDPEGSKEIKRFTKKSFEQFRNALIEEGYYLTAEPLSKAECQTRVLNKMNSAVRDSQITSKQISQIFEVLWSKAGGADNTETTEQI